MSAHTDTANVSLSVNRRDHGAAAIVVLAGVALLVARPLFIASTQTRITVMAVMYLTIGMASIAVPVDRGRAILAPWVALGIGVAAIAVAAFVAGTPVPVPWSAAALPLSLLAAVAEEALFRRVAYARLERFGVAIAVVGSAVLFGLVHVPAYGVAALPVDVGAGLMFGWQRSASGTWTVPAATHVVANLVAVLR